MVTSNSSELSNGTYTWAATLTNAANATAQSEWQRIYLCDAPSRVGLVSPLAGANTSSDVVFSWDAATVALGFPCVESGAGTQSLTVVVRNATSGEAVASHLLTRAEVEAGTASWNASAELGKATVLGELYTWEVQTSNGDEVVTSEARIFTVAMLSCALLACQNNGRCAVDETTGALFCVCPKGLQR